jgi:hypothetical protein
MSLSVKGDYFLKQCYEICPCNGDGLCSLWGTDWILKYSLDELRLQSYFYSSMKFSSSVVLIRWWYLFTYLSHVPSSYYEQVISSMFGEDLWLQLIILIITIYLWLLVAGNWLLLRGGIAQSIQSTAAIFWRIVRPGLSFNAPYSATHAVWLYQRHLAVKQKGGEKWPWILLTLHLNHATQGSFTCRKILRHGTSCFTSHPKEGVLRIFIAIKKFIALVAFEPASFGSSGKHTNHYATETTFRSDIWGISYLRNAPCNLQFHHYA